MLLILLKTGSQSLHKSNIPPSRCDFVLTPPIQALNLFPYTLNLGWPFDLLWPMEYARHTFLLNKIK